MAMLIEAPRLCPFPGSFFVLRLAEKLAALPFRCIRNPTKSAIGGTHVFGFGKSKLDDFKSDVAKRLADGGNKIDAAITAQLTFAVDHLGTDLVEAWEDAYTRYYIFGAYDSLCCDFPIEIRQKIGSNFVEIGFKRFATLAFDLSEAKVQRDLQNTFALHAKHPTYPATIEGGNDGLEARQGRPALRLLAHMFEAYRNPEY
ncbi:hypothetical protein [uncultured Sphingomonas sp.]|uniref:hypothetical protein n=1 Tax=uncultured Sphingomonas sp. TaxID=158754 RepID=UPI0035C9BD52